VFGQTYQSAPNSRAAKDFAELRAWIAGGDECEAVSQFRFDASTLRDVTPRQAALYNGAICLVLSTAPRDFHTREVISGKLIRDEGIDDHHLFPAKYLERHAPAATVIARNCVLNRTLIDRTTNQMIQDQAPSNYLAKIRHTKGFPFESLLESHWLPSEETGPLMTDDFDGFLSWRQDRFAKEIGRVTGAKSARRGGGQ
jgi:hypothetical protein